MDIQIITVGKPDRDVRRVLIDEYVKRLGSYWPAKIVSVAEERLAGGRSGDEAMRLEAERIRAKLPDGWKIVAMDRTGKTMSSPAFAKRLRTWQDDAVRGVALIIGGPHGIDPELLGQADLRLSFGPMTLPHDLALVVLAEQLYRAMTIVQGHPYHR